MTPLRAVLFDWDGTLADTAEASFRCYVRLFQDLGIPFDRQRFAETYSPNWYHTFRCVGLDEQRWAEADQKWLAFFAAEAIQLMDGAIEVLELLSSKNVVTGIVTSGSRPRIERELAQHGVARHFTHVVCGSDIHEKKPHPEALHLCLSRLGVEPAQAAYVGDSPEDVLMARAAGVYSVAVRGSYPNADALAAAGPDLMADTLLDAVGRLLTDRERPS